MRRPERRFWLKLAARLGATVGELQDRISSREFAEWMAYDRLDPIGDERADLNAGIVAAMIANANRDTSARPEPYSPLECMATYDGAPVRREPSAVVLEKLKAGLRLAKAELERKKKRKAKG